MTKMKALYPILIGLLLFGLNTQKSIGQEILYEKTFGDSGTEEAYEVLETSDGGLLLLGGSDTDSEGFADIYVIKTDANGEEEWTLKHGGADTEIPRSGIELPDGSFIIVGFSGSFSTPVSRDVYYIRVDASGNILWTQSTGGTGSDEGTGIAPTSDGGFMLCGFSESLATGFNDGWLVKIDADGVAATPTLIGGDDNDQLWDIQATADGGFIATGVTYSYDDPAEGDLWLVKLDATGTPEWEKTFGTPDMGDQGWEVTTVEDGYVAVGITNRDPLQQAILTSDGYFLKVDLMGNLVWDQTIVATNRLELRGIATTADDGFIVSGQRIEDNLANPPFFLVTKTDANGNVIWTKNLGELGAVNRSFDVIEATNGDYVAVGYSGYTQAALPDLYLVRIAGPSIENPSSITSIEGVQPATFSIYPNPSSGPTTIQWNASEVNLSHLVIRSISGQIVGRYGAKDADSGLLNMQLEHAGFYLVEGLDDNGSSLGVSKLLITQ